MSVAVFNLTLDPSIGKTDKKIGMEAVTVVKKVLINAGMDEGDWVLRDAKRITKKGHQKFKVIRVEVRGGAKYIRLWCKPRGNDTSYEYSLVPPHGVDVERLFLLLQRTNSVSLTIPESLELPIAVFDRIVEAKPKLFALPKVVMSVDFESEKKKKERILEWDLEDLGLSHKIQSSLKELGIKVVGDLVSTWAADLFESGMSEEDIYEIERKLSNFDLNFKTKDKTLLETPITDLGLCVLSLHGLSKCGVKTVGDLVGKSEQEISSIKNFRDSNVTEIKSALASRGLSLSNKELELVANSRLDTLREEGSTNTEIAKEFKQKPNNLEKISSLLILEPMMLFEQEAMDKSLLAIAMVSEGGYVRRVASSSSIIENLGIKNFVENICEGRYTATDSAMKSLMTALKNNNYIERVRCSPRDGGQVSDGVKGYKLTPKAEKRIEALIERCEENISSKINPGWGRRQSSTTEQNVQSNLKFEQTEFEQTEPATEIVNDAIFNAETISKLKDLISDHEKALEEIGETNKLINNLIEEKRELSISQTGFNLAEQEKIKQIDELKKELELIRSKKQTIETDIEKKESEIKNWESYKEPFVEQQAKIEKEISRLTGRSKV